MSLLRTVAFTYSLGFTALGLGNYFYTRKVKKVEFPDIPQTFKKYFTETDYHGFYQKTLLKPIDMQVLVDGIFKQSLYYLEYGISQTTPPDLIHLVKGQKIGNLTIEYVTESAAVFIYKHDHFNFRLFLVCSLALTLGK
jgi:hypothetical protein